jgi:hypothetical protein
MVRSEAGKPVPPGSGPSSSQLDGKAEDVDMFRVAEHLPSPPTSSSRVIYQGSNTPASSPSHNDPPSEIPPASAQNPSSSAQAASVNESSSDPRAPTPAQTPAPEPTFRPSIEQVPQKHNDGRTKDFWPRFNSVVADIHNPGWRAIQ